MSSIVSFVVPSPASDPFANILPCSLDELCSVRGTPSTDETRETQTQVLLVGGVGIGRDHTLLNLTRQVKYISANKLLRVK